MVLAHAFGADRAHRIGQLNPVFIHRLVARNTVEDKIVLLQKKKRALADGILSDSDAAADLTKDDILACLQFAANRDRAVLAVQP